MTDQVAPPAQDQPTTAGPAGTTITPTANGQGSIQSKAIGKYTVSVIREKCIGAASCTAIAPGVFQLDEEKIAIIIAQDGADDDTKLLAAQSCPTMAIVVTDNETGKQVWPIE